MRTEIDAYIETGEWNAARAALERMWRRQPGSSVAAFAIACRARLLHAAHEVRETMPLVPCRLALLRSCTLEPAAPLLEAAAFLAGIDLTVEFSPFNAYAQQILAAGSELYAFKPSVIVLAVQTRDLAPELWDGRSGLTPADRRAAVDRVCRDFSEWVEVLRGNTSAGIVIHNLERPAIASDGLLDAQAADGQAAAIEAINRELRHIAAGHSNVYILDYDNLVARHGRERWHDAKKWMTMRLPLSADSLPLLASEWLRFLHPLTGRIGKVLVTDLDNTIWGGVIGEDGISGIRVGPEYPGVAFLALQRAILDQYRKGVLIAIASKNNPADVAPVFDRHPEMLLRNEHFAARRVNWNDKSTSLREIASELNVGLDSLVFLDDNPVERERVRRELPAVTVIELPDDPMEYAAALRNCPMFERLKISGEDLQRTSYYAGQERRRELERKSSSIEDFYYSLEQTVEIRRLTADTLTRAAQLTQKTNQFNLTTRRYTEAELAGLARRAGFEIFTVRVRDRFGDNGVVGLAIASVSDGICHLDTLLLSCRVIGRTVETALFAFLVQYYRRQGVRRIEGWFIPTNKNTPAASFYSSHGFRLLRQDGAAALWSASLDGVPVSCPAWIALSADEEIASREYASC